MQNYSKLKLNVNFTHLVSFLALDHSNIGERNHLVVRLCYHQPKNIYYATCRIVMGCAECVKYRRV